MSGQLALREMLEGIADRRRPDLGPIPNEVLNVMDDVREDIERKLEYYRANPAPIERLGQLLCEGLESLCLALQELENASSLQELEAALYRGYDGLDLLEAAEEIIDISQQELSQSAEY